jgi:hypothetical protein
MADLGLQTGCRGECLFDEGGLAVAVGISVGVEPLREGSFQLRVGAGRAGMGAQVVAEREVACQLRAVGRADVEVVGGGGGRAGEGFPPGDAEVALVLVAEGSESGDSLRQASGAAMTTSMSMMGLAGKPGTAVLPTCSIRWASGPRTPATWSRSPAKVSGQRGS